MAHLGFENMQATASAALRAAFGWLQSSAAPHFQSGRWSILLGSAGNYRAIRDGSAEQQILSDLTAMQEIFTAAYTATSNGKQGLLYFTGFNVLCYHFTGWVSVVALTYGITIAIFSYLTYEFSQLADASQRLQSYFTQINTRIRTEQQPLNERGKGEIVAYIQSAEREITRLQGELRVATYFSYPCRVPLQNITRVLGEMGSHFSPPVS